MVRSILIQCIVTCAIIAVQSISLPANQLKDMITRHTQDIGTIMEDTKTLLDQQEMIMNVISSQESSASPEMHNSRQGRSVLLGMFNTEDHPEDCFDIKSAGHTQSGLYTVYTAPISNYGWPRPLTVYCDMLTDGRAWITILRRKDKLGNFAQGMWKDYKGFFGNPTGSFWLGLENIYQLTNTKHWKLRVELEDWEGNKKYAEYTYFRLGGEDEGYRLYVSGYSGSAGDGLSYHSGQKFSTVDRDNDESTGQCSQKYNQAWWYRSCCVSGLTGKYYEGGNHTDAHQGVYWRYWKGAAYSYKKAEMKIMPFS